MSHESSFSDFDELSRSSDESVGHAGDHSSDDISDDNLSADDVIELSSESSSEEAPPPPKRRVDRPFRNPAKAKASNARDKSPRRPAPSTARDPLRSPHGELPKTPGSMSKQWCYTINSPRKHIKTLLRDVRHSTAPVVEYHVFQFETGASGTLHVQGFICLAARARLSTVKTLLGGTAHLEITRGTPSQAAAYCKDPAKRDPRHADFCYEWGQLPAARNQERARNDITEVKAAIDAGTPMSAVASEYFSTWVRHYKAFDKYRTEFVHKPRSCKSIVFVFDGETGCGKSAAAFAFRNAFPVPPGSSNTTWFDGYDPDVHPTVVFDDMHGGRVCWTELLRLTDQYPMTVNSKGAHIQFRPEAIVFTSNVEPINWYKPESVPDKGPFLRRIDHHWRYFRADTKVLAQNIITAAETVAATFKFTLHGICECIKGDPKFHPHYERYFEFETGQGVFFAIRKEDEPPVQARPALW